MYLLLQIKLDYDDVLVSSIIDYWYIRSVQEFEVKGHAVVILA